MALSLTVLGCAGTYAGPGNACSGYLVQGDGLAVWLDTGPGTLAHLQTHVGLDAVDAVVVTHSHPDHWLELPVFRNACKYGLERAGVPVFAPADVRAQADYLGSEDTEDTFAWHVIGDGATFEIGRLRFSCSRTDHPVETLAMRIDLDGRTMAYSADTGPGWSFASLGPGIDVGLCEATLLAHQEGRAPHLSGRQAGAMARSAGVGRLVLTHLWPTSDPGQHRAEAEESFGGPVAVAAVGRRFDV